MDELLERKRERSFEAENAEGCAVELDVFEGRFVGSVIRRDGVDSAIGETVEQRLRGLRARLAADSFCSASRTGHLHRSK